MSGSQRLLGEKMEEDTDRCDNTPRKDNLSYFTRTRNVITLLLLTGLMQVYALRVILSVSIISIAKEFKYDNATTGLLSSAFFIGYMPFQIPNGWAAGIFGAHKLMLAAVLIPSAITAMIPPAAGSIPAFIALRILTGVFESAAYPSVHALGAKWSPKEERASFVGATWSGAYIGTALTLPITGALIAQWGWPSAFYCFAVLGVVWSIFWWYLGASSPELHSSITAEERAFIIETRGNGGNKSDVIPWVKLFTSLPVLAVVVAHTTHNWLFYTMLTWMPSYLNQVLGFDVENSGAVSVLPYLACFACSMLSGVIADKLTKNGMKVEGVRKVMQFSGEMTAGIALGIAGYINNNVPLVIFLLVLSTGASGLSMAGYACNHLDIAPQFAGITLGMTNTMATLPGIIAPILVGDLVAPPHNDVSHWREAFLIASGISTFGFLFFYIFAKGEPLPELLVVDSPVEKEREGEKEEEESEDIYLVTK